MVFTQQEKVNDSTQFLSNLFPHLLGALMAGTWQILEGRNREIISAIESSNNGVYTSYRHSLHISKTLKFAISNTGINYVRLLVTYFFPLFFIFCIWAFCIYIYIHIYIHTYSSSTFLKKQHLQGYHRKSPLSCTNFCVSYFFSCSNKTVWRRI